MKARVLHIINGEFFAGAERVQDLLALWLPEFGYECEFVCLKDGVFSEHRKSVAPLSTLPMRSRFDVGVIKQISEYAKGKKYEVIHTHTPRSALVGRAVGRELGLPLVHHVHSPTQRDSESALRNFANSFIEDRLVLPGADHLIAVSASLKRYLLERRVSPAKVTVVPNGVPVVRDTPAWLAPADEWMLGTVALFRPRKGIEVLLKSLRLLLDRGHKVRLKAVGAFETPAYEQTIKRLAGELGLQDNVIWTGFRSNVHDEMAGMHAFVLPSLFGEGLPMVVIEAMSVGIPIVSTRVEGIPEVIGASNTGLVVEPNDVVSLANGIQKLVLQEIDALKMVHDAHKRQRNFYSDSAMAKAVSEVYSRVLSRS